MGYLRSHDAYSIKLLDYSKASIIQDIDLFLIKTGLFKWSWNVQTNLISLYTQNQTNK